MDQDQLDRTAPRTPLIAVCLALALILGFVTLAVWLFIGRGAFQGGAFHVIADRGLALFGLLAFAWAVVGLSAGWWPLRDHAARDLALAAALAWLAQGVIVVGLGQILADELRSVLISASVWLTATGVVLQPIAVFAGSMVGVRLGRRPRGDSSNVITEPPNQR